MQVYTVNLEAGRPFVEQAVERLLQTMVKAKKSNQKVIKFIHGYGSSGKGGKIKTAVRKQLVQLQKEQKVWLVIPGDRFDIFDHDTQLAMQKHFYISKDSDLGRANMGITVAVLK